MLAHTVCKGCLGKKRRVDRCQICFRRICDDCLVVVNRTVDLNQETLVVCRECAALPIINAAAILDRIAVVYGGRTNAK